MADKVNKSGKLDTDAEPGHLCPGSLAQLGQRIRAVVELFENREMAAHAANISKGQVTRYVTGETSKVPLEPLLRLCEAKGVRIEWLATGRGSMLERNQVKEETARYELPDTFEGRIERLKKVNAAIREGQERLAIKASDDTLGSVQGMAFAAGLDGEAIEQLLKIVQMAYDDGFEDGLETPPEPDYEPDAEL